MAYAGHRASGGDGVRTVVTRMTRSGRQVQVSPRDRSPYNTAAYKEQLRQAQTFAPNPLAGINPALATMGAILNARPGSSRMPGVTIRPVDRTPMAFDVPPQSFGGHAFIPPQYALGDAGEDDYGQFSGFSLKSITSAIKKVASPVQKAVAAVGHTVGNVVTSKVGQGILGAGLALTGIGAPAAAGIFAVTKGVGNLIKPGGNLKHAVTGAAQGAIEGVASVAAGAVVRKAAPAVLNLGKKILGKGGSAVGSTGAQVLEQQITGPTGPYQGVGGGGDAAAIADAQRQIAEATAAATAAQQEAARQAAEAAAAAAALKSQGQDAAAAAVQEQAAELARQKAAADAAAAAAAQAAQAGNGSTDPSQLAALVAAAQQAQAAAAAAAAAPPIPAATGAVYGATQAAQDAVQDAAAGVPQDASVVGSLTSNPLVLVALVGGAALLLGGKKKRGRKGRR